MVFRLTSTVSQTTAFPFRFCQKCKVECRSGPVCDFCGKKSTLNATVGRSAGLLSLCCKVGCSSGTVCGFQVYAVKLNAAVGQSAAFLARSEAFKSMLYNVECRSGPVFGFCAKNIKFDT